jgi:hypothetical protein
MDEVQFHEHKSPRKVLESILGNRRQDRLTQAGLASSENTAIPFQSNVRPSEYQEPRFAGVTFTRGKTLKTSNNPYNPTLKTYDKWKDWPSKRIPETIAYNDQPVVNVMRKLPNAPGRYLIADDAEGTMYAEIRTEENPQFQYSAHQPPETPAGYEGQWYITAEEHPRWEFIGERVSRPQKAPTQQTVP